MNRSLAFRVHFVGSSFSFPARVACWMLLLIGPCGNAISFADDLAWTAEPFLSQYCGDCHSGGADEGGLDMDIVSRQLTDVASFHRWEQIYDRVAEGEMPPPDADQPDEKDRASFIRLLGKQLFRMHADQKGTVMRRLNRREYQNTLNDLFGTNLDLESMLPKDGRSKEFDNVGSSLSISMVQLQQYLTAIDTVMDAAIETQVTQTEPIEIVTNYDQTSEGKKHIGTHWKQLDDGAVVFFRRLGYPTGMLRSASTKKTGRYLIRVSGYAYQSDQPITFSIGATTFARGAKRPTFGYRSFQPGQQQTVELTATIDRNYMVELTPWGISDDDNEIRKNGIDQYNGPGLAITEVQLIGPLVDQFPSRGHRLIFDGLDRQEIQPSNPKAKLKSRYRPEFEVKVSSDREIEDVLMRIATKAFRRQVARSDVKPFLDLYQQQVQTGQNVQQSLRSSVAAIFCSPDFLYLIEEPGWLDHFDLCSRLAYFLTRTLPDDQLLAARNVSSEIDALRHQVERLLDGPHADRFVRDFTDAWLNLRNIEFTSPDKKLFPEYDQFLQDSMLSETRQFVAGLVDQNGSVSELIKSDYAMLNNRLARHYKIAGIHHPEVKRVKLPKGSVRGGLLSQGSILKVSANGTNTSPVVRGVYVMTRILGVEPSPPPPGIPGVEPDIRGSSTLRELLDKHRDSDNCRSCHQVIDPPGFALESFDPIGGWRQKFRSLGHGDRTDIRVDGRRVQYRIGPEVDASGQLQDGSAFTGYAEFREILTRREDQIAKALITKLLTFATGREMGFSDRPMIQQLVKESKQQGHGVRDMIKLVVCSPAFRTK